MIVIFDMAHNNLLVLILHLADVQQRDIIFLCYHKPLICHL